MIEIHIRQSCDCENGMRTTPLWEEFNAAYIAAPASERNNVANAFWREHGCDWTVEDTLPPEEEPCQKCGGRGTVEEWVPLAEALERVAVT